MEILFRQAEARRTAAIASGKSIALGCVIVPRAHVVTRPITRAVTLVMIVSRTSVAAAAADDGDGDGMPLVDPFEPRVSGPHRSRPLFAPMLPGVDRVNTLDMSRKSSMRISSFPDDSREAAVDLAVMFTAVTDYN